MMRLITQKVFDSLNLHLMRISICNKCMEMKESVNDYGNKIRVNKICVF